MPFYTMPDQEKLYVREIGQGHPVLILSGLGMQSWQWLPYIARHLKQYKFIIPDWRGFGGSKNCAIPPMDAISSHWNDLNCLMNQLPYPKYQVIAYSMGATTAMHGMQYGDFNSRIQSYLHIDQTPKMATDQNWQYGLLGNNYPKLKVLLAELSVFFDINQSYKKIDQLPKQENEKLVKLWMKFMSLQSPHPFTSKLMNNALNQRFFQKLILPVQNLEYFSWYTNNYLNHNEDYRDALKTLKAPTTFFMGAQSSLYSITGQNIIADSMPYSKRIIFERSGHTPLINEPLKFSTEMSHFLKDTI